MTPARDSLAPPVDATDERMMRKLARENVSRAVDIWLARTLAGSSSLAPRPAPHRPLVSDALECCNAS